MYKVRVHACIDENSAIQLLFQKNSLLLLGEMNRIVISFSAILSQLGLQQQSKALAT